jgi:hypothetical protein
MPLSWAGFASRVARQPCSLQNQVYVAARRQMAELRALQQTIFFFHDGELSGLGCDFISSGTYLPATPPSPLGVSCGQVALIVRLADGVCR